MKRLCNALLLVVIGACGLAQESAAPSVAIPLIATDSHHRPVSVTVESLIIKDQKTLITGASLVRGVDLPVELGILIDTSGSQRSRDLTEFLNAAKQLASEIIRGPEDRVFVLKFSATPVATEWLKGGQLPDTAVHGTGGGTALYDAVVMACKERMGVRNWHKPTRRILVLLSDGEDKLSHATHNEAASEALKAGVVIFAIDTDPSGLSYRGVKIMQNLAGVTGGEYFSPNNENDVNKAFTSIRDMTEGMYCLRYVPPDASKRAIHEVEVKAAPKETFKLSYASKYLWNP
jgi:VWFA-related protein